MKCIGLLLAGIVWPGEMGRGDRKVRVDRAERIVYATGQVEVAFGLL